MVTGYSQTTIETRFTGRVRLSLNPFCFLRGSHFRYRSFLSQSGAAAPHSKTLARRGKPRENVREVLECGAASPLCGGAGDCPAAQDCNRVPAKAVQQHRTPRRWRAVESPARMSARFWSAAPPRRFCGDYAPCPH